MADLRITCEAVVEAVKYGDALYPLSRPVLAEMAQAWLTLNAGLPKVQDDRGLHSMDPLRLREVQADAKRYRWIKSKEQFHLMTETEDALFSSCFGDSDDFEAALDAAMKEHPQP